MNHSKSNPLILVDDLTSENLGPSENAGTNKKRILKCLEFFAS